MLVCCFWKYILLIQEVAGLIIVTLEYVIYVDVVVVVQWYLWCND